MQDMKVIKGTACDGCGCMTEEGCDFEHVEREIDAEDVKVAEETGRMPCCMRLSNLEFAELATQHLRGEARERAMMEIPFI